MRILFLANHLNTGGISSYLLTLGSGLVQKGHEVILASSGGQLEDKFVRSGIRLLKVPLATKSEISPKIIISFWRLKKLCRQLNIDLIHSHSRTTQVLGCWLGQALAKPHIFTCHGFFKPRFFRRRWGCWGQQVIAISQQVKEHLIVDFKLKENKISVIHNGIDTKKFGDFSKRDKLRDKFARGADYVIGIIARLSPVKGQTYLIRAMPQVVKRFPGTKLLIIGQGKTEKLLIQEARGLGLEMSIVFIPEIENTQELLCALDVFVMPSLQEGLGLALMEAMAQPIAVVGSAVGGIKTLIEDKVNGLLVEPADSKALANSIILLLEDPALRQRLSARSREFIIANFSQGEMVDKTEGLYRRTLELPPKKEEQ